MNLSVSDLAQLYRNQGREVPEEFQGRPELEAKLRAHKYGAIKKQVDGITFDSTSEAEAYGVLKLWEAAGAIIDLELQPVFVLQEKFVDAEADGKRKTHRAIKYIADFRFKSQADTVIVDVKGILTPAFRIKEKLFRQKFPDVDLQIWNRDKVKELARR